MEKCQQYDAIHVFFFSMADQTGSNPADINWFGSHTGKDLKCRKNLQL